MKSILSDLLVGVPECEQVENVALPVRERFERRHAVGDNELCAEVGVDVALAGCDAVDSSVSVARFGT